MENINKTEAVGVQRLDAWLEEWGEVKVVRLDGGVYPEREGRNPYRNNQKRTKVHISSGYADIEKHFHSATAIVQSFLYEKYAVKGHQDVRDFVIDRYANDLPRHVVNAVAKQVESNYKKWRRETAARLGL